MNQFLQHLGALASWSGRTSFEASLLIILILAIQWLLGDRLAPRWKSALWLFLLVRLGTPWLPESPFSAYNLLSIPQRPSLVVANHDAPQPSTPAQPHLTSPAPEQASPTESSIAVHATATLPEPPRDAQAGQINAASSARLSSHAYTARLLSLWIPLVWLLGALAVVVCAVAQSLALGTTIRRHRFVTGEKTLALLEDCKQEAQIHAYLAVVETEHVTSPALLGTIRPRLLLPAGTLAALTPDQLRHVFLHELAHLRRHDIAVNWIMTLLQAIHWFNPLVWYAFARMRADRELACDALALSRARPDESREYGRTFVYLLERYAQPRRLPSLAGVLENQNIMKRRISMIARFHQMSGLRPFFVALLFMALGAVSLTGAQTTSSDGTEVTIEDIELRPYQEGGLFQLVVTIGNNGSKPSPEIEVGFYKGAPDKGGKPVFNGTSSAPPIDAGKQMGESSPPFAVEDGASEFTVLLDPSHRVLPEGQTHSAILKAEIKDGKLVSSRSTVVRTRNQSVPSKKADVVIEKLEVTPYREGGLFSLTVLLRNNGDASSPKFPVNYQKGKVESAELIHGGGDQAGPIEPGKTQGASCLPFALQEGWNEFSAVIDPDGKLLAENQAGHRAGVRVRIEKGKIVETDTRTKSDATSAERPKAVLTLENLEITPLPEKGLHTIAVSLRNNGSTALPAFKVEFYKGIPDRDGKLVGDAVNTAGPIEPGMTFREGSAPFSLQEGTTVFVVVLDPEHRVTPLSEMIAKGLKVICKDGKIVEQSIISEQDRPAFLPATSSLNKEGRIEDKVDLPFVDDPAAIGAWQGIDLVDEPDAFRPGQKQWQGNLFLKGMTILPNGKIEGFGSGWTKGVVINGADKTASAYTFQELGGSTYLFLEWKSGDYTIGHRKPPYYVLKKVVPRPSFIPETSTITADGRVEDKIDLPFVDDPEAVGTWKSVDLVKEAAQFKPGQQQWKGDLFLKKLVLLPDGKIEWPMDGWTRGVIVNTSDKTAGRYSIKEMDGAKFMFFEWKSGDYTIRQQEPWYYVLKKD